MELGDRVEDVLLQVEQLDGQPVQPQGVPVPVMRGLVRGQAWRCRVLVRLDNHRVPRSIKPGDCCLVTGVAVALEGRLHLQVDAARPAQQAELAAAPPDGLCDLSAALRSFGCLLVTGGSSGYMQCCVREGDIKPASPVSACPFPASLAQYGERPHDTERRALTEALGAAWGSVMTSTIPGLRVWQCMGSSHLVGCAAACLPDAPAGLPLPAGWKWTRLDSLAGQVPAEWRAAIGSLAAQLEALWAAQAVPRTIASDNSGTTIAPTTEQQQQSASVVAITGGGAELQRWLDRQQQPLALVHWHASWSHTCRAAGAQLDNLAAHLLASAALYRVDVAASMSNQELAMSLKVVGRPTSRRPGALPVLRSGRKFPAVTAHIPPALAHLHYFAGESAVQEAAALARGYSGFSAAHKPQQVAARATALQEGAGEPAGMAPAASTPQQQRQQPKQQQPPGQQPPAAPAVQRMVGGAAELKRVLQQSRQHGHLLVLVWLGEGGYGRDEAGEGLRGAVADVAAGAAGMGGMRCSLLEAHVHDSSANRVLATGLKVRRTPCVHLYRGMALVATLVQPTAQQLMAAMQQADCDGQQGQPPGPAAGPVAAAPTGTVQPPQAGAACATTSAAVPATSTPAAVRAEGHAQPAAVGVPTSMPTDTAAAAGPSINYNPPNKHGKASGVRRFPSGKAHYYAKMPCLRCGCPWWLGEGWDAACVRCGWTCEQDGYDDDSKPLPKCRARWQQIMEQLAAGTTPPWPQDD